MSPPDKKSSDDIVVFWIVRASQCSECGEDLPKGRFLRMEKDKPLCMRCADLDHLWFLPAGDAALTRRAKKYSKLWAVVVRFARARRRYERQGLLVEEAALERAEKECLEDADARALRRERAAERREELDAAYIAEFAEAIRARYPACPRREAKAIAEWSCRKYSGRVGRSAPAKEFAPEAIDLAVRAHIRHNHTDYDQLLMTGHDRASARQQVEGPTRSKLQQWSG